MSRLSAPSRTSGRLRFRLFRPESDAVILQFPKRGSNAASAPLPDRRIVDSVVSVCEALESQDSQPLLRRARALHRNRCCPHCGRGGAIPLDLGDGENDHWAMPVPGTSTLVGFYCDACGAEWPA